MIRFLPLILLGSTLVVAGTLPKQPSDTPRTPSVLCQEVAHEVNIQVYEGMISPTKARQIVDRCHELYVGEPND